MARWRLGGSWSNPLDYDGAKTVAQPYWSELGFVPGGSVVSAGTQLPATAGRLILNPNTINWVRIDGTAATLGDGVETYFEGLRVSYPNNPPLRISGGSGPGAPGTALLAGRIELFLNGSNLDNAYLYWWLIRNPVT